MKKAIIFGANGQDGYYLTQLLKTERVNVICVSRSNGDYLGDIADYNFVEKIINQFLPDYIFHFAAKSSTSHNFIFENHNSISTGTFNILEVVKNLNLLTKIFICGSALQFLNTGNPIDEKCQFYASSGYAASRIHSIYLARLYRNVFGLKVYVGYLFNHDSPYRRSSHFNKKVVDSVLDIKSGKINKLTLGNLNLMKEFGFAGDVVNAIWIFVNQDIHYEVVIGTGKPYKIEYWVEKCFSHLGLDWRDYVLTDDTNIMDYEILYSKPDLIFQLGWRPKVEFDDLLTLMIKK